MPSAPSLGALAPEVAALHGRLTAIRSEVARVLQERLSMLIAAYSRR